MICDVSGPIGCHLSSRCRHVPPSSPYSPATGFIPHPPSLFIPHSFSFFHPYLLSLFLSFFFSLSVSLSLSLATLDTEDAIRSTQPSPSRIRLRVTSPLGLTRTILPPSPPSSPVLHELPPLAYYPFSPPPAFAGLILVIVPASILSPPFSLALFSSDTSGAINPFSTISFRFSLKLRCIMRPSTASIFSVCSRGFTYHTCVS